jgi:broad specificity phosphatase PhoE
MEHFVRYLTHPEVMIDPNVPVTDWGLSPQGRARIDQLVASRALVGTTRIISSAERKAVEAAQPIAEALGLQVEIRPRMHENDRSATGYLPKSEFEAVADRFFAEPTQSVRGWERAVDAQTRIVAEVTAVLGGHETGDILFVGHGGVGTLLRCWLANTPIDRRHDQPGGGGGCIFSFGLTDRKPRGGWVLLEDFVALSNTTPVA